VPVIYSESLKARKPSQKERSWIRVIRRYFSPNLRSQLQPQEYNGLARAIVGSTNSAVRNALGISLLALKLFAVKLMGEIPTFDNG